MGIFKVESLRNLGLKTCNYLPYHKKYADILWKCSNNRLKAPNSLIVLGGM